MRLAKLEQILNAAVERCRQGQSGSCRWYESLDFDRTDAGAGDAGAVGELLLRPAAGEAAVPDAVLEDGAI